MLRHNFITYTGGCLIIVTAKFSFHCVKRWWWETRILFKVTGFNCIEHDVVENRNSIREMPNSYCIFVLNFRWTIAVELYALFVAFIISTNQGYCTIALVTYGYVKTDVIGYPWLASMYWPISVKLWFITIWDWPISSFVARGASSCVCLNKQ